MQAYVVALIPLATLVFIGLFAIRFARRAADTELNWRRQSSQNVALAGSDREMAYLIPAELPEGMTASGAPIDDMSHHLIVSEGKPNGQ